MLKFLCNNEVIIQVQELKETNAIEYVVRKYLRDILNMYWSEISRRRKVLSKDKVKFGFQVEKYRLNVGYNSEPSTTRAINS